MPPAEGNITGVSIDSRQCRPGDLFVAIAGERFDGHDYVTAALQAGATAAVVHRPVQDVPIERLLHVRDTRLALGALGAYYRSTLAARVIAVTGSNGKTTTKTMIHHVLSGTLQGRAAIRSFNNDIGVPLTLLSASACDEFLVVEIGTSAPGEIETLTKLVQPDIAAITSIGLAHLDGLGSLDGIVAEKSAILDHLAPRGIGIVNIDEPLMHARLSARRDVTVVTVGAHAEADVRASNVRRTESGVSFMINDRHVAEIPVMGSHNALNAVVAFAVGRRLGLEPQHIINRLATFEMPDMRLNVNQFGSMMVINDAYNANPASMRAALDVLRSTQVSGRRVAILGDMRELGGRAPELHREIGRLVASSDVDVLVGVGEHADQICDSARQGGLKPGALYAAANVEELAGRLDVILEPRDTILMKGSRAVRLEKLLECFPRGHDHMV
jgi:UDP-N-acetylmuramoyl-tripeptide--D-alanyl-D-alanine ligase